MNSIVPEGLSTSNVDKRTVLSLLPRILMWAQRVRRRIKISRLGKYSAERIRNLNTYCQRTSLLRVILIEVLAPWPALLLELLAESIPLQHPALGWKANSGAWCRLWIGIAAGSAGSLFQIRASTPELTKWKFLGITVGTACGATAITISLASVWVFPIPFCVVVTGSFATVLFVLLFVVAIKKKGANFIPTLEDSLRRKIYLIVAQVVLVFAYISYSIAFTNCTYYQRFGLLILLPIIKIGLKHMIARIASNDEDSIPAVVVFSVDVFNGLYTSICMQSSGTWWASFLMITFNATNTVLSVLEINRAARIFNELNRTSDAPSRRKQVWNSIAPVANTRRNRSSNLHRSAKQTASAMSISGNAIASYSNKLSLTTNKLRVPAKLLFYLEYRALVGYIEAAIPLMYAVYLSILVNLPSAKYYPHARALTPKQLETTIGSIIAYSSTEMLSLVWLHVVVRRKFGFSLLYQLAFVLETEPELLQGRLLVWIVILLQLPLVHFGADFGFQLEWVKKHPA